MSLRNRRFGLSTLNLLLILCLFGGGVADAQELRQIELFSDQSHHLRGNFVRQTLSFGGLGLGGLAWLDYDVDGDLDLYVTNGPEGNALYRNDRGVFVEVAEAAGAALGGRSHNGVVAGDLNNDGYPDLVVLGEVVGPFSEACSVLRNRGNGTFEEVTSAVGIEAFPTMVSAALLDYDRDGLLDVFIAAPGTVGRAGAWDARVDSNRLYRNLGDFVFQDVTTEAGIFKKVSGCAAAASDFDQDGWVDIVAANCNEVTEGPVFGSCAPGVPCPVCSDENPVEPCRPPESGGGLVASVFNFWRNNGDGTFTDLAEDPASGLGEILGYWMSVTPGDFDGDGDIDYFGTNLSSALFGEPHALVRNNGDGTFTDVAGEVGVAAPDFGWGASFADFDLDGDLDLFANGNVPALLGPLGNPGRLYVNEGGRFTIAPNAGFNLAERFTSGNAVADFNRDGKVDIAIFTETVGSGTGAVPEEGEKPILMRNRIFTQGRGWVSVRLVGSESNAQGIGARITVRDGVRSQVQEVYAGSSFASSESPWPTFAVGRSKVSVEVRWPNGLVECFPRERARTLVTLVEGRGESPAQCR